MSIVSRLSTWLTPARAAPEVRSAYTRACELVGPILVAAQGAERRLAPALVQALAYCDQLVDSLQPAARLAPDVLGSAPDLHAVFPAREMLVETIGCSPQMRAYIDASSSFGDDEIHALLVARRRDRQVFGVALEGETLRRDVAQTLLNLTDPTLVHPTAGPAEARARMRSAAFDSLLVTFAQHMQTIRDEVDEMRVERGLESTYVALLRQTRSVEKLAEHARKIDSLNKRLSEDFESLQPDRIVDTLSEHLSMPEQCLRIESETVTVTRNGVIVPNERPENQDTLEIELHELISRDRRKHVVIPVRIPRDFAAESVRHTITEVHRAFLL